MTDRIIIVSQTWHRNRRRRLSYTTIRRSNPSLNSPITRAQLIHDLNIVPLISLNHRRSTQSKILRHSISTIYKPPLQSPSIIINMHISQSYRRTTSNHWIHINKITRRRRSSKTHIRTQIKHIIGRRQVLVFHTPNSRHCRCSSTQCIISILHYTPLNIRPTCTRGKKSTIPLT